MATNLPFDYSVDSAALQRRQAGIDQFGKQIMTPQQGQMVGNQYVGVSPLQAIAQVVSAYMVGKQQEGLDTDTRALAGKYNTAVSSGLQDYFKTRNGAPDVMHPLPDGQVGPPGLVSRGVAADPHAAAVQAVASGLAPLQQIGMEDMKEQAKGQIGLKDLLAHADPNSIPAMLAQGVTGFQPKQELKAFAPGEVVMDAGGRLYNPKPAVQQPPSTSPTGDPAANPGWGTVTINGDLYQKTATGLKKLDNAPKINVNNSVVNKGESEFSKHIGEASAKELIAAKQAKVGAQRTIQSMQQLEALDNRGVMSGPGAPVGMFLGSLAQSMGLPVDQKKLANSQAYQGEIMSNLTSQLTTGSLARSTTDKDMEILKAPLPELLNSPEGRAALRRQAVARAQETIQYADDLHKNTSQAFPEMGRLLDVTPGTVPMPPRMDTPQAPGGNPSWLPQGFKILNVREK